MSSSITTEKSLLSESESTLLSLMMHKEAYMMQSWSLSTITMERSFSCTVQVDVGRHLFATLLLRLFMLKEKLLYVLHHQELHHFFLKVEEQLTLPLKPLYKSMTLLSVTSL